MAFSSTIKIAQLDDYINPSQDCVIPILNKDAKIDTMDPTYMYSQAQETGLIIKKEKTQTAQISLSDCLACSGCVTTAETILQQEQSITEFLDRTKKNHESGGINVVVASIQTITSLASHFKQSVKEMKQSLNYFFQTNYPEIIFYDDMKLGNLITLQQCSLEFQQIYEKKVSLPLMASECPGWTCYAEKAAQEHVIQHMSVTKSPQQALGKLFKSIFRKNNNNRNIYFTSIMPCYDKKVESARKEFETEGLKDVDTVLTTTELIDLIKETVKIKQGLNDQCCSKDKKDQEEEKQNMEQKQCCTDKEKIKNQEDEKQIFPYHGNEDKLKIKSNTLENTFQVKINENIQKYLNNNKLDVASNGYLDYILSFTAKNILNLQDYQIQEKKLKNSDFWEYNLMQGDQKIISFAKVYGLKNIQNLLRNIKINKCKYAYIEIMACPSGCINGGGQMKSLDESIKPKEFNAQLIEFLNQDFKQNNLQENLQQEEQDFITIENLIQQINQDNNQNSLTVNYKHIDKNSTISAYNW